MKEGVRGKLLYFCWLSDIKRLILATSTRILTPPSGSSSDCDGRELCHASLIAVGWHSGDMSEASKELLYESVNQVSSRLLLAPAHGHVEPYEIFHSGYIRSIDSFTKQLSLAVASSGAGNPL